MAAQPRRAVTGRALVLGTVVVLLVVLLASPLNRYFGSRSDVNSAGRVLQRDQQHRTELRQQKARWSDPGYLQRQARQRLQYAMPGDTVYVVVDHGQQNLIDATRRVTSSPTSKRSWNDALWGSVQRADSAP